MRRDEEEETGRKELRRKIRKVAGRGRRKNKMR